MLTFSFNCHMDMLPKDISLRYTYTPHYATMRRDPHTSLRYKPETQPTAKLTGHKLTFHKMTGRKCDKTFVLGVYTTLVQTETREHTHTHIHTQICTYTNIITHTRSRGSFILNFMVSAKKMGWQKKPLSKNYESVLLINQGIQKIMIFFFFVLLYFLFLFRTGKDDQW